MRTAVSSPSTAADKAALVTVRIEMVSGDVCLFPQMERKAIAQVFPKGETPPAGTNSISLVNAVYAVVMIPFHLIQRVQVGGEEWWVRSR